MDRRDFLQKSLLALALGEAAPSLLGRTALAAKSKDKILVIVQLSGGNDGLNTVVPFQSELYQRLRPNLALKREEVLDLAAGRLALHPGLRPLMPFWESGELALIPQAGYPNASRSHFVSMAVWHTADPTRKAAEGWLGRYLDDHTDPFCETNLGTASPLALQGDRRTAPSVASVDGYQVRIPANLVDGFNASITRPREGAAEQVRQAMLSMMKAQYRIATAKPFQNRAQYPRNNFGMADIARMIAANLGSRVYYTQLGGFDTHAGQLPRHAELLGYLAQTLAAFRADMQAIGRDGDVMVLGFSEFGRRAGENASFGTDHGHGGLMFALGGRVKGGLTGEEPDLEDLDQGDLRFKTDFRSVYASALEWIQANPRAVLGADFSPLALF